MIYPKDLWNLPAISQKRDFSVSTVNYKVTVELSMQRGVCIILYMYIFLYNYLTVINNINNIT